MQPLASIIVTERIHHLQDEAAANRLATTSRATRRFRASAWRRLGGAVARSLSATLAAVAVTLDPAVFGGSYVRE